MTQVNGSAVYPAAGMLVMALEACKQLANADRRIAGYTIKDASFHHPLPIALGHNGVEVQLCLRTEEDSFKKDSVTSDFRLYINSDGRWDENCRGHIQLEYEISDNEIDAGRESGARLQSHHQIYEQAVSTCDRSVPTEQMYENLGEIGLGCGPAFRGIRKMFYNDDGEAIGKVRVFQWKVEEGKNHPQQHIIHPTTLDSLFQLMLVALAKGTTEFMPTMMITRITNLWISNAGISYPDLDMVNVFARASFTGHRKGFGRMFALHPVTSDLLLSIEKTEATTVANRDTLVESRGATRGLCYSLDWRPDLDLSNSQQALKYCESARPHRDSAADSMKILATRSSSSCPIHWMHWWPRKKSLVKNTFKSTFNGSNMNLNAFMQVSCQDCPTVVLSGQICETLSPGKLSVSVSRHQPKAGFLSGLGGVSTRS